MCSGEDGKGGVQKGGARTVHAPWDLPGLPQRTLQENKMGATQIAGRKNMQGDGRREPVDTTWKPKWGGERVKL